MAVYCAFLRGINVNGVKMNMKDLSGAFKEMGFLDAITVLGTGNVVFSAKSDIRALKLLIEHALSHQFSYDAHIFLRNMDQVKEILNHDLVTDVPENYHLYYLLLDDLNVIVTLKRFFETATKAEFEGMAALNNGLLWLVPKGQTLSSDFGKHALSKKYVATLTSRNINTINKVYSAMQSLA